MSRKLPEVTTPYNLKFGDPWPEMISAENSVMLSMELPSKEGDLAMITSCTGEVQVYKAHRKSADTPYKFYPFDYGVASRQKIRKASTRKELEQKTLKDQFFRKDLERQEELFRKSLKLIGCTKVTVIRLGEDLPICCSRTVNQNSYEGACWIVRRLVVAGVLPPKHKVPDEDVIIAATIQNSHLTKLSNEQLFTMQRRILSIQEGRTRRSGKISNDTIAIMSTPIEDYSNAQLWQLRNCLRNIQINRKEKTDNS